MPASESGSISSMQLAEKEADVPSSRLLTSLLIMIVRDGFEFPQLHLLQDDYLQLSSLSQPIMPHQNSRRNRRTGSGKQKPNAAAALDQAMHSNNLLRDENFSLSQLLGEKTRTIAHMDSKMRDLAASTSAELSSLRRAAAESDEIKEELLVVGTKAVANLRIKLEDEKTEKENVEMILRAREKSLVELQDAWISNAPVQTKMMVEAFSERSLSLVRNLKADLAAAESANLALRASQAGAEALRKQIVELRAKSERENAALQELRRGREEDARNLRAVKEGKRAAVGRAVEARKIAEQQELVIGKLLTENERQLKEFPSRGGQ